MAKYPSQVHAPGMGGSTTPYTSRVPKNLPFVIRVRFRVHFFKIFKFSKIFFNENNKRKINNEIIFILNFKFFV
jgi:hypothetical protein